MIKNKKNLFFCTPTIPSPTVVLKIVSDTKCPELVSGSTSLNAGSPTERLHFKGQLQVQGSPLVYSNFSLPSGKFGGSHNSLRFDSSVG